RAARLPVGAPVPVLSRAEDVRRLPPRTGIGDGLPEALRRRSIPAPHRAQGGHLPPARGRPRGRRLARPRDLRRVKKPKHKGTKTRRKIRIRFGPTPGTDGAPARP